MPTEMLAAADTVRPQLKSCKEDEWCPLPRPIMLQAGTPWGIYFRNVPDTTNCNLQTRLNYTLAVAGEFIDFGVQKLGAICPAGTLEAIGVK